MELPGAYERMRVLILGSSTVSYSKKHGATNCTGGLVEASGELVRLYPIPRIYLDYDKRFRAFQRIEANVRKSTDDPRPESYKVDPSTIELGDVIETTKRGHAERRRLLEGSTHNFDSLEHLKRRCNEDGTSLGIVRPKEIVQCRLRPKSAAKEREWNETGDAVLSQGEFGFDVPVRRLDFVPVEFVVQFLCDDPECREPHQHVLRDWGIHELYRRLVREADPDRDRKVVEKMEQMLNLDRYDVFMFFGNFHNHQRTFGLMGSYSCPKGAVPAPAQATLFG